MVLPCICVIFQLPGAVRVSVRIVAVHPFAVATVSFCCFVRRWSELSLPGPQCSIPVMGTFWKQLFQSFLHAAQVRTRLPQCQEGRLASKKITNTFNLVKKKGRIEYLMNVLWSTHHLVSVSAILTCLLICFS